MVHSRSGDPARTAACERREPLGGAPEGLRSRRRRIALYSHDTMGLGHMRRNVLITQALAHSPCRPVTLLVAGAREAGALALPPGVDWLTLPALRKEADGHYESRHLDLTFPEILHLRGRTIRTALEAFEPDVFIVDNVPRGAGRELDGALASLRASGRTRCVLGLRDVLDEPIVVSREWFQAANEEAIHDYYDAIWIYGDPKVYDPVHEYRFPVDIAAKVRYTGYLDQTARLASAGGEDPGPLTCLALPPGRLALCLVGGGQDGAAVAEAFAAADLPGDTNGVILTGPFMPPEVQERLRRRAEGHPRLRVLEFVAEPTRLLAAADHVVAMGGYNTVCEVLSFGKRALIVPRVKPRREQILRAERLRDLGLLDVLHPDDVGPGALTAWLARAGEPPPRARERIDLNGLGRLPSLLEEVLALPRYGSHASSHERRIPYVVR